MEVLSQTPVSAGHLVTVAGALGLSGTQRALFADTVLDLGPGDTPRPLFTVVRALGGSDPNASTPGITGGKGLYNIGLLVRIAGSVSYANVADPNAKVLLPRRRQRRDGRFRPSRRQGPVRRHRPACSGHGHRHRHSLQ